MGNCSWQTLAVRDMASEEKPNEYDITDDLNRGNSMLLFKSEMEPDVRIKELNKLVVVYAITANK